MKKIIFILFFPLLALAAGPTQPITNGVVPSGGTLRIQSGGTIVADAGSTVTGFGGGGSPGGSDTQVQYNAAGVFAGNAALTFNSGTGALSATSFSGAGTGLTGTAASLTAGNVTTNANLTGAVTSAGNATSLGSFSSANLLGALTDETGSGVAVFGTSPAFTTSITTPSATFTALAGATTLLTLGGTGASASTFFPSTLDTSSSVTGAIRTSGGISAAKALNIGTTGTFGGAITDTAAVPQIVLGVNTTTKGGIKMFGNTSGDVTISPLAVAGTATALTFPATSGGLIASVTAIGTVTGTPSSSNFLRGDGTWATPSGSGTVTVVSAGSLTSTALVTGGGTTTLQTPSATATMDSSGNISTPGTLTVGNAATTAGAVVLTQGTTQSTGTTNVTIQAPAAVTSHIYTLPGTVGTNGAFWTQTTSGTTATLLNTKVVPTGTVVGTSDTQTLTAKRVTARVLTVTSSATPTANTDNADVIYITALAAAITNMSTNLTGTPAAGDQLEYWIVDNATPRAISWGSAFTAGGAALPTTTTTSKPLHVFFERDPANTSWFCQATYSDL